MTSSSIDVSGIDPTKPATGSAFTADVRANTAAIKAGLSAAASDFNTLGSAAFHPAADFATASQGAKADAAVQPNTTASLAGLLTGYVSSASTTSPVIITTNYPGSASAPAVPASGVFSVPTARCVSDGQARLLLDSVGGGGRIGVRVNGGSSWDSPDALTYGSVLFTFSATGYNGASYPTNQAGALMLSAAENWTPTATGTMWRVLTTKTGETIPLPGLLVDGNRNTTPGADNESTYGSASLRIKEVFAASGAINTSDAREKTAVRPLSPAELAAAQDLATEIGAFQFLESVAKKGDAARLHVGMTVQRAIEVLQSHGLDPMAYSFICHDAWEAWEVHYEANPDAGTPAWVETHPAGDRYSFRPDGLLAFILRGLAQTQSDFSTRLAALESRLAGGVS